MTQTMKEKKQQIKPITQTVKEKQTNKQTNKQKKQANNPNHFLTTLHLHNSIYIIPGLRRQYFMGNRSMILSTLEGSVTASWPYVNT
jgi:hypothetical protein